MNSETAWMIRNDGMAIPVVTHIYADKNETDELLAAAYFLWEHDPDSRDIVHDFCDTWAYREFAKDVPGKFLVNDAIEEGLNAYLEERPYRIFPKDFVEVIARHTCTRPLDWRKNALAEPADGADLLFALNQRFMRARYGKLLDTGTGRRNMYFRVSSTGFDWLPVIRGFVRQRADGIKTIIISNSADFEGYYTDSAGLSYNMMPLAEFLAGSGTTRTVRASGADGWRARVAELLAEGRPLRELRDLPANYGRIRDYIAKLQYEEEAKLAAE